MNAKKLWVYLGVLVVVAGGYILSEWTSSKKTPEKETPPVVKVTPGAIQEIRWQRGGEVIELKKNKIWEIVKPLTAPADPLVLDGVLQGVSNLRADRSFQPTGGDLTEYGLNPPQTILSFSAQGKGYEIKIGAQAAVGNARYFQVAGSSAVYLAAGLSLRELDRDLLALREKKLFSLNPEQVEKVEIRTERTNLEMDKTAKGWYAKGTPDKPLSKSKVEALITELTWAKARTFLDGEKENPAWGLQASSVRIRLTGNAGKIEETLALGAQAPGKGLYARSSRYGPALIIDGGLAAKVPADLAEWEERTAPPGNTAK